MKKFYALLLMIASALPLSAQPEGRESMLERLDWNDRMLDLRLDMRVDGRFRSDEGLREWGFTGQTFKLWVVGEIVPGVRYRVRHRLNRPQEPMREGFSSATDHAWVAFDFGARKEWTVTVGKQSVQFGTFEYDYNPADIYLGTMAFNELDAYKTGVNVAYRFAGQVVNFQVVNSDAPQFASEQYRNKALAFAVLWEGSLLDGAVKTRWAYNGLQHSRDKLYSWVTAGVQLNADKFTCELDYYFGDRQMDYGDLVGAGDWGATGPGGETDGMLGLRPVRDQSAALAVRYDAGRWRPSLKGVWDNRRDKLFGSDAYRNLGLEAAVEFYPFVNPRLKDLRFHFAYYYLDTAFRGQFARLDSRGAHTALVGMRWLFKAL